MKTKLMTIGHLKAYLEGLIEGLEGKIAVMKDTIPDADRSLLVSQAQGELAMAQKILANLQMLK